MNKSHLLVIFLTLSLTFHQSHSFPNVKKHARTVGKVIGTTARLGFIVPALKVKGALLAAPILAGKAIAIKTAALGAMALPAGIGAIIGAPIGAIVGAKVGAIKGALIGKAILAKKLLIAKALLAKKLLIAHKVIKTGAIIAAKPILIAAGLKTALIAKKAALLAKAMAMAGKGIAVGGKTLSLGGARVTALTTNIHSTIEDGITNMVQKVALPALPALPVLPALALPVLTKRKGPFALDIQYSLNTPITGPKFGKALILGNRKRRSADAEAAGNAPSSSVNINQLIQFVQKSNAQQCLARVICELSANPNVLGVEGIRFGTSLLTMSRVNHPGTSQYRTASIVGSRSRNPTVCSTRFPNCSTESSEVVRVGNNLISG